MLNPLVILTLLATLNEPQKLGLFVDSGLIASPRGAGGDLSCGIRWQPFTHVAFSFDVGYGLLDTAPGPQDRWWLLPAVAVVFPTGPIDLELGAALGVGESSAFDSTADLLGDHTRWSYQLVPEVRAHLRVTHALTRSVDLFMRLDVATLLADGNAIGLREGASRLGIDDAVFIGLSLGFQFRLL